MSRIHPDLRQRVARRDQNRCAYCLSQEIVAGMAFTVDYIIPRALGGDDDFENLCLACWDCNLAKQSRIAGVDPQSSEVVSLYHPNKQQWDEHFEWVAGGRLMSGKTAVGRATINSLRLNRPVLLTSRERWMTVGWHPPAPTQR